MLLLLAFLAPDRLLAVLDPLALIGLGRAERADLGGDLADPLAIGAADRDRGRPLAVDPHIPGARFDSSFGAIVTAPSAIVAVTSLVTRRLNVPRLPLAVRIWPSSSTATPAGIATGFLPIRDIAASS